MKKSNWPNDWDLSHPNWTGRSRRTSRYPLKREKEELSAWAKVGLGVLIVTTFLAANFAL